MVQLDKNFMRKSSSIHLSPNIISDTLSTISTSDLSYYIQTKREKQRLMKEISVSKLFVKFERENSLNTISHQVHLAETIELISGIIISDDIRQYRGLLINLERVSINMYLFYWFFRLLDDFKTSRLALESYSSFWYLFELLWKQQFPWGLIRPGGISHPISSKNVLEIEKIVFTQQKTAWEIAKAIEKKTIDNKELKEVIILSADLMEKTGITGPIARTSGAIPVLPPLPSFPTRLSAQNFLKYTYTAENNLLGVLRVSYTELILALERILGLLKEYPRISLDTPKTLNGEATTSFPTSLGESHLTISIIDNQVTYFNFIPPQMINIAGILESLSTCPTSLQLVILLFFDPEFLLNQV